jgi:hypothetical protein
VVWFTSTVEGKAAKAEMVRGGTWTFKVVDEVTVRPLLSVMVTFTGKEPEALGEHVRFAVLDEEHPEGSPE